jgi:dienelactone hydrolase
MVGWKHRERFFMTWTAMQRVAFASSLAFLSLGASPLPPMLPLPEKVSFPSADGATVLTGYLFRPETKAAAQAPAVVMMHGRGGVYSSLANGDYSAKTISRRHQEWGHLWARQGYFALMVDGFGPRGYAKGFPRFSYDQRPKELDEVNVRPLDAYGALIWLRKQNGVAPDKIVLQGWSNGASATLAAIAAGEAPGLGKLTTANGFRAGLVFYPACGLKAQFPEGLSTYAPLRLFHGTADEEVSPRRCQDLVEMSRKRGADIAITLYPDAEHGFDDPGKKRQSDAANAAAKADATAKALGFVADVVKK